MGGICSDGGSLPGDWCGICLPGGRGRPVPGLVAAGPRGVFYAGAGSDRAGIHPGYAGDMRGVPAGLAGVRKAVMKSMMHT